MLGNLIGDAIIDSNVSNCNTPRYKSADDLWYFENRKRMNQYRLENRGDD